MNKKKTTLALTIMRSVALLIACAVAIVFYAPEACAKSITITNSYANCRSAPGANNAYLGRVYRGQIYELLASGKAPNGKTWYRTEKGWVCSAFATVNPENNSRVISAPTRARVKRDLGMYKITGYCYVCNSPAYSDWTAKGHAKAGRTCAVNRGELGKLPYGTHLWIEGIGERVVEDNGCDEGVIDVYCAEHADESKITGMRHVWIIE